MRGIGIRSPFQFFNEDDIRREALKKELHTIVQGLLPLLNRYAEIIIENNLQPYEAQIATSSGIVFGLMQKPQMRRNVLPVFPMGEHPPFPHTHGDIVVEGNLEDLKNVPPEVRIAMAKALEQFLKDIKDNK